MVKNNPRSQQLVMEVNGIQPLLYNLISDPDTTSRTKALGAISSLIMNNKPGITAFQMANGYAALLVALEPGFDMLLREALNLILYLLHENSSDNHKLIQLRFHHYMIDLLFDSEDAEVREATLRGLLVLAKDEEGGTNGQLVKNDDRLKQSLRFRIEDIFISDPEYLDNLTRGEIQLMDSLWNVCYNEPCLLLRRKGLLELPGEDAPASDVASKLFVPPLRGPSGAAEAAGRVLDSKKEITPFYIKTAIKYDGKLKQAFWELKLALNERKQVPQEQIERIIGVIDSDGLRVERVERQLTDTLWNACYHKDVLSFCYLDGTSA